MVHYAGPGSPAPICQAAIVTAVHDGDELGLTVFTGMGTNYPQRVKLGPADQFGTWHWPERVDE